MAPINSNYIKSGSTIQNAVTKNTTFNVGATGGDDYGPTNQTGFYKGIIPPPGGYTIYMHKESQGPSIHVAHDDEQCIFFLKSFGATGSTISDVLAWSTGRTDIWVQTQEITLQDLPNNNSLLVYLDAGNLSSYNGSGNTWFDLQGENNVTLYNTPTYSSNYNGILNFNDTSLEYGTIPNLGDLNTWTVEVWFRISTTLSTGKITSIVSNQYNLSDKLNFSIGTNNSPINYNLSVGFYDGAWRSTTGFVPEINTWYQVVGTYDGTTLKQYVNGNLSGGTLSYVGSPQSGGETRLMRRWDSSLTSNNMVNGDLAIVKIYNTAISSENILQSYNNTYTRFNTPATSTPIPATSTPTPTPTITNTPIPATSTPTPEPTSTSTPIPVTNTPTPEPTVTSTPTPTIVSPVSSGLELYYDPSNSSSYPGSGTTLYDLSSSAVNATLSGSPTDSGNWFTFTGTQSIVTGNLFSLFSGWQHSLEIWFSPSAAGSVFSDTGAGPTNTGYHSSGLEVYQTGPFYNLNAMLYNGTAVTRVGGGIPTLNSWYQLVRVYNGSNTAYAYLNKVKSSDTSITWSNPTPGWYLNFGSSESTFFATGNRFQGKIGVIRLYNRVLTQSEITQNFDAEKSKYGL